MNLVDSSVINHHVIYGMEFISLPSAGRANRFSLSHISPFGYSAGKSSSIDLPAPRLIMSKWILYRNIIFKRRLSVSKATDIEKSWKNYNKLPIFEITN